MKRNRLLAAAIAAALMVLGALPTLTVRATGTMFPSQANTAGAALALSPTQTPRPATSSTPITVRVRVAAFDDDGFQDGTTWTNNTSSLWIGDNRDVNNSYAGLRFAGVGVPHGAAIQSASLKFYSVAANSTPMTVNVYGDASGNSAKLSAASLPGARPHTAASTMITNPAPWAANTWYAVDVSGIVKEIVSRADWAQGNALSVLFKGSSGNQGARRAVHGDTSWNSNNVAELTITYTATNSGAAQPPTPAPPTPPTVAPTAPPTAAPTTPPTVAPTTPPTVAPTTPPTATPTTPPTTMPTTPPTATPTTPPTATPAPAATGGPTYFVAPNGNDGNPGTLAAPWRTISRAAQSLVPGETIYLRGGTYNERVDLSYKGNAAGPYVTFAAYPGEQVVLDGTGLQTPYGGGVFHIWKTNYIRVSGLKVQNAPAAGIYVAYADHVSIENNATYNTVTSGVGVWGSTNVVVDGNDVALACNPGGEENITIDSSANVEVRNNHVHDGPKGLNSARAGGEGINVKDGSSFVRVHHNTVNNLDKLAFGLDGWNQYTHDIEYFDNLAYNSASGFIVESEQGGTVQNVKVYNNIAYHNTGPGLYIPNWALNDQSPKINVGFINNTAYANGTGVMIGSTNVQGIVVRNNIFSQNTTQAVVVSGAAAQTLVDRNLFDGGVATGTSPVAGNPLFANPAGADFHLQAGSAAIDAGLTLGAPSDDFYGDPRPQGAGYDLGADEFTGGK